MAWPHLLPTAVIAAVFFWPIRCLARGHWSIRTPADLPIFILMLMIPITGWTTAIPEKTIPQVCRLLTGVAFYYSLVNWCITSKRLQFFSFVIVSIGLSLALIAPFSVEWAVSKLPIPASFYNHFVLLVSDTIHPNVLAGNIVIFFPLSLSMLLFLWNDADWIKRIFLGITTLIPLGVLVLTQSRGAWIACAATLVTIPALRWRQGWIGVVAAFLLVVSFVLYLGPTKMLELVFSGANISIEGRMDIWSRAIYMIEDFPLTGIGMGSFQEVAEALYPFSFYSPGDIHHTHNLFLQVAVDLGLPGFIAWMAILLVIVVLSWRLYRSGWLCRNSLMASLGAGLICSQLALIVHGTTDAVTWGMVRPAPLVWIIWGFAVAAWSVCKSPETAISGESD